MAGTGLQMTGLFAVIQTGQHGEGCHALARGRDVVLLALDRHHGDLGDGADIDPFARDHKGVSGDFAVLEDALDRGQVEFRRHVHHGEVFVVKAVMGVVVRGLTIGHAQDLVLKRLGVAFGIHRNEAVQLHQAGIDQTACALVFEADALDRHMLQLAHGYAAAEVGHVGRGGIGIDRAADQGQAGRLRLWIRGGEIGGGGKGQGSGLADGDDMHLWPQIAHEINQVEGIILDIELACGDRNVAGIVPVGHINFGIGQQAEHGGAQQRGIMAGHRGHHQNLAGHGGATTDREMDQAAEGLADHGFNSDQMILTAGAGDRTDAPVRLDHHAGKAAFGDLAPGGGQLQHRVHRQREGRIGRHGAGGGPHPFIGIADAFHQVVSGHILHLGS